MVNKSILVGRLGKDPVTREANGKANTSFSLATSFGTGDQEKTEWHNVVLWGKAAENAAKYLTKGSLVYVEGRISYETYEKDGEKKYITKIVGERIQFLSTKGDKSETATEDPF